MPGKTIVVSGDITPNQTLVHWAQRIEHHCSEIINETAGLSRRAHKATTKDVQKDFKGGSLLAVIACRLNSLAAQR